MPVLVLLYHKLVKYPSFDLWWKTFEWELKVIKSFFKVITLDEVLDCVKNHKCPKKPSVVITFDDGYADNYVYAYPLLKKHKLKATLFITTSRIIREDVKRKTLEDYWKGRVSYKELYKPKSMHNANWEFLKEGRSEDFLSVEELKSMKDVFEFGWHSKYHTKDFYKEEVLGFYKGKGHWSLIHAYGELPQVGYPILPLKGSLAVRKGVLRKEVKDFINSLDRGFFKKKGWERVLKEELKRNFKSLLEFESQEERKERMVKEIEESIRDFKEVLGYTPTHSAYPFGDYDPILRDQISQRFSSALTTNKGYADFGQDPYLIPRITVPKDMWSFMAILGKYYAKAFFMKTSHFWLII